MNQDQSAGERTPHDQGQSEQSRSLNENKQREHYNALAEEYEVHYGDPLSIKYRDQFFHESLLSGVELKGTTVLEAMSGSGFATPFLERNGASVIGLDISEAAIESFRQKHPNARAICASILSSGLADSSVDGIIIIGGLHHLHPHVSEALHECLRVLKPNGFLACAEPHAQGAPNLFRRLWYYFDNKFEDNESAIDFTTIEQEFSKSLRKEKQTYGGGPAYFFIFNSLVLRTPALVKTLLGPPLLFVEKLLHERIPSIFGTYTLVRYRKSST